MPEIDFGESNIRRLPIYLLIDCGSDMLGHEADIKRFVSLICNSLMGWPQAVEMAYLSIITFADTPRQIVPLTPIATFEMPVFQIEEKKSDLNAALAFLWTTLSTEAIEYVESKWGDYPPGIRLLLPSPVFIPNYDKRFAEYSLERYPRGMSGPYFFTIYINDDDTFVPAQGQYFIKFDQVTEDTILQFSWQGISVADSSDAHERRAIIKVASESQGWQAKKQQKIIVLHGSHGSGSSSSFSSIAIGASIKGDKDCKLSPFREDAFDATEKNGWFLIAVSDGFSESRVARISSNAVVNLSITSMAHAVAFESPLLTHIWPNLMQARSVLLNALSEVWNLGRSFYYNEFSSTTLLLLAYHPASRIVSTAQIGDGLIAVQLENGEIELLGESKPGELLKDFVKEDSIQELEARIRTRVITRPKLLIVMTDGIADDLYPPVERLYGLVKPMPDVLAAEHPEQALTELISYERPGSDGDRTLVVVSTAYADEGKLPHPPPGFVIPVL